MSAKKGKFRIEINRDWCKCCYLCVAVCPQGVFARSDKVGQKGKAEQLVEHPENCVGCSLCQLSCPDIAITITEIAEGTDTKQVTF